MFYKSVHLVCDTIQDVKIQWQNNQKARTEIHIYIEKVFLSFTTGEEHGRIKNVVYQLCKRHHEIVLFITK